MMEEKKGKSVGMAATMMLVTKSNNVMLEETDGGPAIIRKGRVYFPWVEVAWERKNDTTTMVESDWDTTPIADLLEKWERGTIATIAWETLEKAYSKIQKKEVKTAGSPIPGDPGKTPKPAPNPKPAVANTKAEKTPASPTKPKPPTKPKEEIAAIPTPPEPIWEEQDSYLIGVKEKVDVTLYTNRVVCEDCGAIRWTKVQDAFQVHKCKPCAKRARRKRRAASKKARTQTATTTTPTKKEVAPTVPTPAPKKSKGARVEAAIKEQLLRAKKPLPGKKKAA